MTITDVQLTEWSQFACELVEAARSITTRHFRTSVPQEVKTDATPVTLADQETETVLREMIREYYPGHGILGEESGSENRESEFCWVIDPIDGTRPFLAGIPTYVTLVALCHRNAPLIGVIDQPVLKERWLGVKGKETVWTGDYTPATQKTDIPQALSKCLIGTSDPTLFNAETVDKYRALRNACAHQICGGDGYLYGRLASGALHVVCEYGLKAHDFAALVPVIEGASGIITDWSGKALTLDSKGDVVAAANKELHIQALEILTS